MTRLRLARRFNPRIDEPPLLMTTRRLPRISVVRVYGLGDEDVGYRILVDRLWPRGLSKQELHLDEWLKELAPSTELRRWFDHRPERWTEFQKRYRAELQQHQQQLDRIAKLAVRRRIALLYGARDQQHNEAIVLAEVLEARRARKRRESGKE
jgi:uncharacterized protein YeaO (DUF488 family)